MTKRCPVQDKFPWNVTSIWMSFSSMCGCYKFLVLWNSKKWSPMSYLLQQIASLSLLWEFIVSTAWHTTVCLQHHKTESCFATQYGVGWYRIIRVWAVTDDVTAAGQWTLDRPSFLSKVTYEQTQWLHKRRTLTNTKLIRLQHSAIMV